LSLPSLAQVFRRPWKIKPDGIEEQLVRIGMPTLVTTLGALVGKLVDSPSEKSTQSNSNEFSYLFEGCRWRITSSAEGAPSRTISTTDSTL
jgi:hypothetical protein